MTITDEQVKAASEFYKTSTLDWPEVVRGMLEAAEKVRPKQLADNAWNDGYNEALRRWTERHEALGPQPSEPDSRRFGLSQHERARLRCLAESCPSDLGATHAAYVTADVRMALAIIDRAVSTLVQQPSDPEPARDVLTAEEREAFAALFGGWEDTLDISVPIARKALARIAPEPSPVSPLEALLAEMRVQPDEPRDSPYEERAFWRRKLEASIKAEQERKK